MAAPYPVLRFSGVPICPLLFVSLLLCFATMFSVGQKCFASKEEGLQYFHNSLSNNIYIYRLFCQRTRQLFFLKEATVFFPSCFKCSCGDWKGCSIREATIEKYSLKSQRAETSWWSSGLGKRSSRGFLFSYTTLYIMSLIMTMPFSKYLFS